MTTLIRRILAAPKHLIGYAVGLVSVLAMILFVGLGASQAWGVRDDTTAGLILAGASWVLHLTLARLDLDDDTSWFAACLRGMSWAARCAATILVPIFLAFLALAGIMWLAGGPPALWLTERLDGAWMPTAVDAEARGEIAGFVCAATGIVLCGAALEWLHAWFVVSLMSRTSRPMSKAAAAAAAAAATLRRQRAERRALRRRTFRASHPSPASPAARALLDRNRAFKRWARVEFVLPIVVLVGAVSGYAPEIIAATDEDAEALDVVVILVLLWGLGALGSFLRLGVRTPFRQARLVLGTIFAMLGVVLAGVLGLLAPLGIVGTSRARHWALATRIVGLLEALFASRHTLILAVLLGLCSSFDAEPPILGLPRGLAVFLLGMSGYSATILAVRLARRLWLRWSKPVHLVLLRVFGDADRARFLVRRIASSWHGIGNVAFIGAPDTAAFTLDVRTVAGLLFGRLRDRFIKGWEERDAAIEAHLGRRHTGSNHDFLCFDDTWKPMLRRLLAVDAVVLMDLRGFSSENAGCVFELENLVERVPLHRVVLLVDSSTDRAFLDQTLARAWSGRSDASPNAGHDVGEITVFDCDGDTSSTATRLVERLAEAAARPHTA